MTDVAGALGLVQRGWGVFPGVLDGGKKVPIGELVERGFKDATLNPKRVLLWWRVRPDAIPGVAMPPGTVALDVDDPALFAAAGLELPDGPGQRTPRGGYHRFFRTDGRPVRQTVKEIPGADTRVAGRGYVFAWQPEEFPEVDALPMAPEWLYDHDEGTAPAQDSPLAVRRVRRGKEVEVASIKMGERDNGLARIGGGLRRLGLGPDAIYAAFKVMVENGQVEQSREDPITDKDLRRIAGSIGTRQSDAVDKERRPDPERHNSEDILAQDHGDLKYFVEELIPEGVGLIGGPPKVGKSWLVLQSGMAIATGGAVLDRKAIESPVLYFALEDGPRRAKARMLSLMGTKRVNLDWLEWRFDAPLLGEGLEDDIERWIADNSGGVVLVDVLAMVQPEQRGRGSAYNADYTMLKDIRARVKSLRAQQVSAAVAFVTHVRKMGAEDPFATLQGTTGVTGSTDWAWVIKRARMDAKGTIQVNGRDIEKEPFVEAVFNGAWTAIETTRRGGSKQRNVILDALMTEGDSTAAQVRKYVNERVLTPNDTPLTNNGVSEKLNAMQQGGLVDQTGSYLRGKDGGIVWHAYSEDEIKAVGAATSAAASKAEAASGHGRGVAVTRSTATERASRAGTDAGARERARPHPPQVPHLPLEPMESVEGVEGALRPGARMRSRAQGSETEEET